MWKKMKLVVAGALIVGVTSVGLGVEASPDYEDPLTITGKLEQHGKNFYVDRMELKFGDKRIAVDFNGDGRALPIYQELRSMVGQEMTVSGFRDVDPDDYYEIYVTSIDGKGWPNPRVRMN